MLSVHWAPEAVDEAYEAMYQMLETGLQPTPDQTKVAVDALRACGAKGT